MEGGLTITGFRIVTGSPLTNISKLKSADNTTSSKLILTNPRLNYSFIDRVYGLLGIPFIPELSFPGLSSIVVMIVLPSTSIVDIFPKSIV